MKRAKDSAMASMLVSPTVGGERVLSTLNEDGSRRWIRPRPAPGRFLSRRRGVAWGLIALFTLLPYLRSDGKPLFLLDLAARRFTLFGRTFLPTDTLLLAIFMVGVFITIFLLTALFGRVWCGWACPQTVYMEFLYRPIERLFEGTPGRVNKGALAGSGVGKVLKYAAYLVVSMFLAHTFLAWFVGVDRLLLWVRSSPSEHPIGFAVMAAVTGLMLFDFGWFREQVCLVACPYGRFQSAMLDRSSLIVSYDVLRGEPRGKRKREVDGRAALMGVATGPSGVEAAGAAARATAGDCVDCGMCVTTCPTGIDIREGLQMECINCAQCIDACDAVMTKLKRPTGLIRYSSQAAVGGEKWRLLRPRVVIYPAILLVIGTLFLIVLASQGAADVTVLRGLGKPFNEMPGGEISNQVRIKIVNRTDHVHTYSIMSSEPGVRIASETDPIRIEGGKNATIAAEVIVPGSAIVGGSHLASLRVTDDSGFTREVQYRVLGPGTTRRVEPGGSTRRESDHEAGHDRGTDEHEQEHRR